MRLPQGIGRLTAMIATRRTPVRPVGALRLAGVAALVPASFALGCFGVALVLEAVVLDRLDDQDGLGVAILFAVLTRVLFFVVVFAGLVGVMRWAGVNRPVAAAVLTGLLSIPAIWLGAGSVASLPGLAGEALAYLVVPSVAIGGLAACTGMILGRRSDPLEYPA